MTSVEELEAVAANLGNVVKNLKTSGGSKEDVDATLAKLMASKAALTAAITATMATLVEGARLSRMRSPASCAPCMQQVRAAAAAER